MPKPALGTALSFLWAFLILFHHHSMSVLLSKSAQIYIGNLIACVTKDNGPQLYGIINPPPLGIVEDSGTICLPQVILWNPYLQYPKIIPPNSIQCIQCGLYMYEAYWNDGTSSSRQPRTLHGIDNTVLLVSAVYTCENNHKLLSHDDLVLKLVPFDIIPFHLSHQTGFTKALVDLCLVLCKRGLNFYNMESVILEKRWESFSRFQNLNQETVEDFWSSSFSHTPSNDMLAKCFLSNFLQHEGIYLQEMLNLTVGESISFDHTFKIASNIGYLREDKRWINEYNSVFFVMNEVGQIVTWQLTKGTSLGNVNQLLQDLSERCSCLKTVYVDDCCKLRNKIRSVFGSNVSVKLDLFHAVQRISKTMSKKNCLLHYCLDDLRMVFRQDGDTDKSKRLSVTPSSTKIMENLNRFTAKWQNYKDPNGFKLFTCDTIKAVSNLKGHILAGCLSDIPPGGGTNRNEQLHKHLRSYFNQSRVGILLAYSLLTVILYSHNASIKVKGKNVIRPIAASLFQEADVLKLKPIGIMSKHDKSDHWEQTSTIPDDVDIEIIASLYQHCREMLNLKRSLKKLKLSRLADNKLVRFQVSMLERCSDSCHDVPASCLVKLSEYGLSIKSTEKDGNCFFNAISLNMLAEPSCWIHCNSVTDFDITGPNVCRPSLSRKLREVFVQEITGENKKHYEGFIQLPPEQYFQEANKFLQDGFYSSDIGDLMPMAMANVLQASIVVIPTNPDYKSPMYMTPISSESRVVAFLIYNQFGSGHYDAALPYSIAIKSTNEVPVLKAIKCNCGVNKKGSSGTSCSSNVTYASRCKCFRDKKSCTSLCRCKNCGNPFGLKIEKPTQSRSRRSHIMQKNIKTSKEFATERGEKLLTGFWSDFEEIVLLEVLQLNDINLVKFFNAVVSYSCSVVCPDPLTKDIVFRQKTKLQIEAKQKHMQFFEE